MCRELKGTQFELDYSPNVLQLVRSGDINKFLEKYGNKLDSDFMLGYFVHLYTDYLWFKYFIRDIKYKGLITLMDGTKIEYDENIFVKYISRV